MPIDRKFFSLVSTHDFLRAVDKLKLLRFVRPNRELNIPEKNQNARLARGLENFFDNGWKSRFKQAAVKSNDFLDRQILFRRHGGFVVGQQVFNNRRRK